MGFVEVDETYIGGKDKNKRGGKCGPSGKTPIVGVVSRGGTVVALVIDRVGRFTLSHFVHEAISHKVSLLSTDEHSGYICLDACYPHGVVNHSAEEYVAGAIHTNTITGWSQFKQGIFGTFNKVTNRYLPLYVTEFGFWYNNRLNPDIFGAAVATV